MFEADKIRFTFRLDAVYQQYTQPTQLFDTLAQVRVSMSGWFLLPTRHEPVYENVSPDLLSGDPNWNFERGLLLMKHGSSDRGIYHRIGVSTFRYCTDENMDIPQQLELAKDVFAAYRHDLCDEDYLASNGDGKHTIAIV
jgi:hypothetical protein